MAKEVQCPAGQTVHQINGRVASRCRIVHDTVTEENNPSGLHGFCLSNFTQCPIWRDKRDAEIRDRAREQQRQFDREAREVGEPV